MIRLVVDASVLVGELLRARGRTLLTDPGLDLAITERALSETQHELARRLGQSVARGRFSQAAAQELGRSAEDLLKDYLVPVALASNGLLEEIARRRLPRDSADWPTVAAALLLNAGIWTQDCDFLGRGLANLDDRNTAC